MAYPRFSLAAPVSADGRSIFNLQFALVCLSVLAPGLVAAYLFTMSPQSEVEPRSVFHDFGEMRPEQTLSEKVSIRNVGSEELHLSSIRTSCSCTSSTASPQVVGPGKEVSIDVTLSAKRFNADTYDGLRGRIRERLIAEFRTRAGQGVIVPIEVSATVRPLFTVTPNKLEFLTNDSAAESAATVSISPISMSATEFQSVELTGPDYFKIRRVVDGNSGPEARKYEVFLIAERRSSFLEPLKVIYKFDGHLRGRHIPAEFVIGDVACKPSVYFFHLDNRSTTNEKKLQNVSRQRFKIDARNGSKVFIRHIKASNPIGQRLIQSQAVPTSDNHGLFDVWLTERPGEVAITSTIYVYYSLANSGSEQRFQLEARVINSKLR